MKKVNLFKEIIVVDKQELLNAINSQKEFGIKLDGSITFSPDNDIVIFKGKYTPKNSTPLAPKPLKIEEFLGHNYKIAEVDGKIGIKASGAWQDIIKINYDKASYDDTTNEGVNEFDDKDLEDIGWWADEFDIKYRELIDVIEKQCDGTLLCIEQEKPYQFSGLGFIKDKKQAYEVLYKYCQEKISKIIKEDPIYSKENLSDDEKEALEYFDIKL
jgi:hypothetical protein